MDLFILSEQLRLVHGPYCYAELWLNHCPECNRQTNVYWVNSRIWPAKHDLCLNCAITWQPEPVFVSYRIYQVIKRELAPAIEITLETGAVPEAELEALRARLAEKYGSYHMTCLWSLRQGESEGLTGTVEGLMKGQRG